MKFYGQFSPPHDQILYECYFRDKRNGFFVEAGAIDGIFLSNCLVFERELDWVGINVEPDPILFESLKKNRPKAVNLCVALWDSRKTATFYRSRTLGWSSVKSQFVGKSPTASFPVQCVTWDEIIPEGQAVDLFSLDVEGSELEVLRGMTKSLPEVIIVEHPQSGLDNLTKLLTEKGYLLDYLTEHNAFFIRG